MNSQNNNEDSLDFSIIDRNERPPAEINFSVQSLLEEPPLQLPSYTPNNSQKEENQPLPLPSQPLQLVQTPIHNIHPENSFLNDLQRFQRETSFQSQSINIYQDNNNSSQEMLYNNKSKTLSCLKLTKQFTNKSVSKQNCREFNDYYGCLVMDFQQQPKDCRIIKINKIKRDGLRGENSHTSITSKSRIKDHNELLKNKSKCQIKFASDLQQFLRPIISARASKSRSKHEIKEKKSNWKESRSNCKSSLTKSHSRMKNKTDSEAEKIYTEYYGDTEIKSYTISEKQAKKGIGFLKSQQKRKLSRQKQSFLSPKKKVMSKKLKK